MKSPRIALVCVFAVLAVTATAPVASSAPHARTASSIFVTTKYNVVDLCLAAPDTEQWAFAFSAKVKVKGESKPKEVVVKYKITDVTTSTTFKETVKLKKSAGYKKTGSAVQYIAEHSYKYSFVSTYRVPSSNKKVTAKATDSVTIGTKDDLAALGLPSCS